MFRVCAVWVLLRLYCPEVTFGQSWGQCFLFVSDLSGKKYMKIKQKYSVCSWGRYTVMTYLLRNIVKTCEFLSTTPFRKVLNCPAVGAEVWALPPLSECETLTARHSPSYASWRHWVAPDLLHVCTHKTLALHLQKKVQASGMVRESALEMLILWGSSSFFLAALCPRKRSPDKKWQTRAGCNTRIAHLGCQ